MTPRELPQAAWTAANESSNARRLGPFAAVALVGVLVTVASIPTDLTGLAVAVGLQMLAGVMVLALPWQRLPSWAGVLPAFAYLAGVGVLRDAAGGPVSGIGALVLLPVLWFSLYGTRLQLALTVPAVGAAFFVPMALVGDPKYPASQWRVGVLYIAMSLLIGPTVQRLIRRVQFQADEAVRREGEIARVADVARRLSTGEGTRRDVCAAACEIGDSAFALLWEPDSKGRLVSTASAGVDVPTLVLDPARERSAALTAFRTAAPIFVAEAAAAPGVNPRMLDTLAAAGSIGSILFQPVLRRGEPAGVLAVGWHDRIDHEEHRVRVLVGLLAAEAAIAIQRADLMTRLEELADTDELTGLPNRRGWNRELEIAISTAERRTAPLCVALIDLDRFKQINDDRGHQAGDRLLKEAASAWRSTLRPADVLARPGGDEFTLVLPDCDLDRASTVLERLREATPREHTCSVGVAQWDGGEATEALVARADEALYSAKEAGRDRVVLAVPS
jgi:diguanylate cyclase (GGDEF)-like protein